MQTISESETSETVCQDSYLLFDTSLVDIPSNKELCYIFLCFLFFSSYKACSFWNSDTLDAIVESAMLNDTIEYWISSSDLPQNINIHGANTAVKFVFLSERGTLVCSWPF